MYTMCEDSIRSEQSVLIVDGSIGRCRRKERCSSRSGMKRSAPCLTKYFASIGGNVHFVNSISAGFSARWVCKGRSGSLSIIFPRPSRHSSEHEIANRGVKTGWTSDERFLFGAFERGLQQFLRTNETYSSVSAKLFAAYSVRVSAHSSVKNEREETNRFFLIIWCAISIHIAFSNESPLTSSMADSGQYARCHV